MKGRKMKILNKSTLSEQVADILRDQIIRGDYAQGEKILEENLAKIFDVSRATIREAMRFLEAEKVLDREVNKHTCVHQFSRKEIRELFAVRRMLEEQSVDWCLKNNVIPFKAMQDCIDEMDRDTIIGWSAWNEYLKADIRFHQAIIVAMGNKYIVDFWKHLQSQYLMSIYMLRKYNPGAFFATNEDHKEMLNGLQNGSCSEWKMHLQQLASDIESMTKELVKRGLLKEE